MRLFGALLALVIAFSLFNCINQDSSNNETATSKEKLLKTIDKFNKAFQEGNFSVIESLIAENYLHTNGNSKSIRKEDWFNYLHKREKEIKLGSLKVVEYKMSEIEIDTYGNTAIVTGKVNVSNKRKKDIQKNEYRVTNVWVNELGNWKRAGFHDGKIK